MDVAEMTRSKLLAILIALAVLALFALAPRGIRDTQARTGVPPPNDDFADAVEVRSLPYSDGPAELSDTTVEPDEPRSQCGTGIDASIWYSVRLAEDATVVANFPENSPGVRLAIWTEQTDELAQVACGRSRVVFHLDATRTYYVQVGAFLRNREETVSLQLALGVPPVNDDFDSATVIADLPFSDAVKTEAATVERGEPGSCGSRELDSPPESSVWYTYTPTQDALVIADTQGSDYATLLTIWTQGRFGLQVVTCASGYGLGNESVGARLAFEARTGQAYHMQVTSVPFAGLSENLVFHLANGNVPANDDFANALDVVEFPSEVAVDTIAATREPGEPTPTCSFTNIAATAWYRIRPDTDAIILMEPAGSLAVPVIGVYRGDSLSESVQIACGFPSRPSLKLAFEASAGQIYHVQVGTPSRQGPPTFEPAVAGQGAFLTLRFDSDPVPSCPEPTYFVDDRSDDVGRLSVPPEPGRRPNIVSVGTSADEESFCIRVEFAEPVAAPDSGSQNAVEVQVVLDTDSDRSTGYSTFLCGALGAELQIRVMDGFGVLAPMNFYFEPLEEDRFAIALFRELTMTLVVPLEDIGGDSSLRFALEVSEPASRGEDCAPDRGFIQIPPLLGGDANCDGRADSRDAAMILQFFARLAPPLPCEHVADVNGDGYIGALDAALILQFDAGLLGVLPGAL